MINRPKHISGLCIEAFLETAHLFAESAEPKPVVDSDKSGPPIEYEPMQSPPIPISGLWDLDKHDDDDGVTQDFTSEIFSLPEGCELDETRGGGQIPVDDYPLKRHWTLYWPKGFDISLVGGSNNTVGATVYRYSAGVVGGRVSVTVTLRARGRGDKPRFTANVVVYYKCPKAVQPQIDEQAADEDKKHDLFLTSRGLTACVSVEKKEISKSNNLYTSVNWDKMFAERYQAKLLNWLVQNRVIEFGKVTRKEYRKKLQDLLRSNPSQFKKSTIAALKEGNFGPVPKEWLMPSEWISFEAGIPVARSMANPIAPAALRIRASNDLGSRIGEIMLSSVGSPHRHARGAMDFWQTRMAINRISRAYGKMPDDHPDNVPVASLAIPNKSLVLSVFGKKVRRKDLLLRSTAALQSRLGINEVAVSELKSALISDIPFKALNHIESDIRKKFAKAFPKVVTRKQALTIPVEQLHKALGLSELQGRDLRVRLMGIIPKVSEPIVSASPRKTAKPSPQKQRVKPYPRKQKAKV